MAKTLRTTIQALASHLEAYGGLDYVHIGEPARLPEGYTAVIQNIRVRSEMTTLSKTIETRTVSIRFYHMAVLDAPDPETELMLGELVDEIIEDLLGDFDLGGTIRAIDPTGIEVDWGYQTIGSPGISFRVVELKVPMIVDDSASFVK